MITALLMLLESSQDLQKFHHLQHLFLAMFLFALTGLPPFALFWGKMYLVASAVNAGQIALAIIIVFNSVIDAY